jgi:hypothetical protein
MTENSEEVVMARTKLKTRGETGRLRERRQRYDKAARLLRQWMSEAGDYDTRVWKELGPLLQESSMRCPESNETTA